MRGLIFIFFFIPVFAWAQAVQNPKTPGDPVVKQGVIKVRKPSIRPYFKCEYYLTLSHVTEVEREVESPSGFGVELERIPVFDSTIYGKSNQRVFPVKMSSFSKMLVEEVEFSYPFEDTSSIDTMVVEMWIGKNGKIRWRNIDTAFGSDMPRQLELELYKSVNGMTEWGKGGGYKTPKKFLRKQKTMAESYYCVLYIIASAKPLTAQQKATGARYAPFDIPLNSPPDSDEQRDFMEGNKITRETRDSIR